MTSLTIFAPKASLFRDKEQTIYASTMNLEFILYDSVDNHKELTDSLGELVTKVSAERNQMAATKNW